MSLSFGNATVSIVANERQMRIERNLIEVGLFDRD